MLDKGTHAPWQTLSLLVADALENLAECGNFKVGPDLAAFRMIFSSSERKSVAGKECGFKAYGLGGPDVIAHIVADIEAIFRS